MPTGKKHFSVTLVYEEQACSCSSSSTVTEIARPDAMEDILQWTVLNKMFGEGFSVSESSLWVPCILKHRGGCPNLGQYCY